MNYLSSKEGQTFQSEGFSKKSLGESLFVNCIFV